MSETQNALLTFALCFGILFGFNYFTGPKIPQPTEKAHPDTTESVVEPDTLSRKDAIAQDQRVTLHNDFVQGSMNLVGAKIDDLALTHYKETTDDDSGYVELLNPQQTENAYYAQIFWRSSSEDTSPQNACPSANTKWSLAGDSPQCLTPTTPVTLVWSNSSGVVFERKIEIDTHYMLKFTDKVVNMSGKDLHLASVCELWRAKTPQTERASSVHEGGIVYLDEKLRDITFHKLNKNKNILQTFKNGWLGFTDKYWLSSFIATGTRESTALIRSFPNKFLCQLSEFPRKIKPGESLEVTHQFFAGAKSLDILDQYATEGIKKFDLSVDFGWLYFLTKPLYYLLKFFNSFFGNLALAIIFMTLLSKIIFFPLARSSYQSMAKMKAIQPKMEFLKRRFGNDKMRFNEEMLKLYKKEKINPASGLFPMLIQIPIFFCLYKVFAIGLEMRHAPLALWIRDLSAPDPTSLFNLFGLIPWAPPSFLQIGVLPLIMAGTMVWQQKMTPAPSDSTQAKMMYIMPIIFLFMFSSFPSGLVLYWTVNNIFSILQQVFINRQDENRRKTV